MLFVVFEVRRELLSATNRLVPVRKPWLYLAEADYW
jgi:hypothetical protein